MYDAIEYRGFARTDTAFCYLGDARTNVGSSPLVMGALLGMDVRIAAPAPLWPAVEESGASRCSSPTRSTAPS